MGLNKFIGQGIFFFTRACAHAYETCTKRIVISAFLITFSAFASAASKETLFQNLKTESDAMKRVSILAQLSAAHTSAEDVLKIEPSLQDADARVRLQAIAVLGNTKHKSTVAPLITVLKTDKDPGVRTSAAFWLGSKRSPDAIDALEQALAKDTEANVRTQAAQALKKIGTARAKSALERGKTDKDNRVKNIAND